MKIFKYVFVSIFAILLVAFISFFKPVSIFLIESYASNLLEQKVEVSSLNLQNFSVDATIENPQNKILAKLINFSPLRVEASFSGDADAFKKYHSLRGEVKADAIISYDEKLIVDANGTLYDAKVGVKVKELDAGWLVRVDAKSLNIQSFKKQNSLDFELDGVVDFVVDKENENFTLSGSFVSPKLDAISLNAEGKIEEQNITSSLYIAMKDKKLHFDKLKFNTDTKQLLVTTKEFGGDLTLMAKDKKLTLDAKRVNLEKIFGFFNYKDVAVGLIDVKLNIPSLEFKEKNLSITYSLNASYLKKTFNFDGILNYKDKLHIVALSNDFKSKSRFELDGKELKVSIKKLDIKEFLDFASLKPFAKGLIDLNARGDFDKLVFKINSDLSTMGLDAKVTADGFFITDSKELNSNFTLFTKLGKQEVKVKGDASYIKDFRINASSSVLGASSKLRLRDGYFEFYTKNLDMQRVAKTFNKPKLPFGKLDFLASGDLNNISLNIRSKELRRDMSLKNIGNYISFDLSGTYKDDILTIKDKINMHYETKRLPLMLDATLSLKAPYSSKGSLIHKDDKIIVESFSFENEQIKSNFIVDIKELKLYKAAFKEPLYGPLRIDASYSKTLDIKTKSFGGELHLSLSKSSVLLNIKKLQAAKLANLFNKNSSLQSGIVDGVANYNLVQNKAKTSITIEDATITGVDIDQKLKDIDNLLGLNVVSMSKSIISHYYNEKKQQTKISQLQLDLSLEDKNIKLDDIALSTKEFLIVAIGNLKDDGDIKNLDVSLVDKNGCAIVTQSLSGNINDPKIARTSSTLVNIIQSVPSSISKTTNKLVDFTASSVDGLASFGLNKIFRADANISITSDIISKSRSITKYGSDMIMPSGCKVIYSGKVMHPANNKKDKKNEKKF